MNLHVTIYCSEECETIAYTNSFNLFKFKSNIVIYSFHSLWLCTFSIAVAICAALLLPISIASNEVLLLYPLSYYVKWLNSSLVHGKSNNTYTHYTPLFGITFCQMN